MKEPLSDDELVKLYNDALAEGKSNADALRIVYEAGVDSTKSKWDGQPLPLHSF